MTNEKISALGDKQIKFYDITENVNQDKPFILITPLANNPAIYASNKHNSFFFSVQIDVQSKNRLECKKIQHEIRKELNKLSFIQSEDTLDEFFKETGRFVDARRYESYSKLYDTDY